MALVKDKKHSSMSSNISLRRLPLVLVIILFTGYSFFNSGFAQPDDQAKFQRGQEIFDQNCKQCHAPDKVVVGPALKDVDKRKSMDWIVKFVHNSQAVIKSGDPYATALFDKFSGTVMPPFPNISADQVDDIIYYVNNAVTTPPPPTGGEQAGTDGVAPADTGTNTLILILIIVVLALVLLMLVVFLSVIRRYLKDKEASLADEDKELVNQKFEIGKVLKSRGFITIVILLFLAIGVRSCWVGLLSIGIEQNYAPIQPVPFSHKLHAGQYEIDCKYCHTGVTRGKQAGIPSVNICMNCHSAIKTGPRFGKEGIAKVEAAWKNNRPIQWVRVHNLPDLAYFNHSQHVVVGNVECETCHGPIREMEVVKQHSPLTMGWCINCHRETNVNAKGNEYYDRLLKLHAGGKMTVAEIGGLECYKCHY